MEDYQAISGNNTIKCTAKQRKRIINNLQLNGISYVEINPWTANSPIRTHFDAESNRRDPLAIRSPLVLIYCFHTVKEEINKDNIQILRDSKVVGPREIDVLWARRADRLDNALLSRFSKGAQDFLGGLEKKEKTVAIRIRLASINRSDYFLKIIGSTDGNDSIPLPDFDSLLSKTRLPLEVLCIDGVSFFDCGSMEPASCDKEVCDNERTEEPILDYMAKDYESFLHLIKNRLKQIIPNWQDKTPADIEIMLLELVAYLGDHLSYFQDAVATEAYLGTARNRISIKRHGRLLDYYLHEGCNSRTWVRIEISRDLLRFPRKTVLFTAPRADSYRKIQTNTVAVSEADFNEIKDDVEVFETMYDTTLYRQNNSFSFYTWGEPMCFIQQGSTKAYLRIDDDSKFFKFSWQRIPDDENEVTRLLTFIRNRYNMTWLKDPEVIKEPAGDMITISLNDSNASIQNKPFVRLFLQTRDADRDDEETADNLLRSITKKTPSAFLELSNGERVKLKTRVITQAAAGDGEEGEVEIQIPALRRGDILAFEIKDDPSDYNTHMSSRSRCHVIVLTDVHLEFDRGVGVWYYEILFGNDPLPFTICSLEKDRETNRVIGNLLLADHGLTIADPEPLRIVSVGSKGKIRCLVDKLENKDLTYSHPLLNGTSLVGDRQNATGAFESSNDFANFSAMSALQSHPGSAIPEIFLVLNKNHVEVEGPMSAGFRGIWRPQIDLLNSNELTRAFVVEREQNGRTFLRFFDPYLSSKCESNSSSTDYTSCDNSSFTCHGNSCYYYNLCSVVNSIDKNLDTFSIVYRVGNGTRGNVGSYSIQHVLYPRTGINSDDDDSRADHTILFGSSNSDISNKVGVTQIYNPIPAMGGRDPEDVSFSREYIPWAFMKQQRAVTTDDYQKHVTELPEIQKAFAEIKWTGNWYTVFITVDPISGIDFDNELISKVRNYLERFRLTGYDTEIVAPVYVPLQIEMGVSVKPHYNKGTMQRILEQTFSNRKAPDGSLGFFHRDRWTFGDSLFLSNIYQTALNVEGVSSVDVKLFKSTGKPAGNELDAGHIQIGRHEIIVLDNDHSKPENGALVINVL